MIRKKMLLLLMQHNIKCYCGFCLKNMSTLSNVGLDILSLYTNVSKPSWIVAGYNKFPC